MNKTLLIGLLVAASLGILIVTSAVQGNSITTPGLSVFQTNYDYNSLCDIGDPEEFMKNKVLPILIEITKGEHNKNPKLEKFFHENSIEISPGQVYGPKGNPNYDPIFMDLNWLTPAALDIIGSSPQVIEVFTKDPVESKQEYESRIYQQIQHCN